MNTRMYPRTLQEAFGPYTSTEIEDPQRSALDGPERLVTVVSAIIFVWLIGMALAGRL